MGIKMNTYAGGQMTAGNDAILHDRAIANTGILHGCNITFMGANQVHIEKGYLLIKGRYCTVTEDTIQVAMSNSETELPGRLYVRADLADAQEPVKILSVAADPLPKLTQDENFNYDNGVWEMELATYTAGMTAIKDLTVTCEEVPEGASKKETAALLGKIDELTENLGKNTFGDKVTLVKDQNYICPSDGYFHVVCGYQEKSRAVGFINDINLVALSSTNSSSVVINNSMASIIFVRAGMTIKYTGTNAQGYFIPLI